MNSEPPPGEFAAALVRFGELVATLRAECPWDRSQTHRSLRRHLLEEVYEVLEAIDGLRCVWLRSQGHSARSVPTSSPNRTSAAANSPGGRSELRRPARKPRPAGTPPRADPAPR